MEDAHRAEILELEKILIYKKEILFKSRLSQLLEIKDFAVYGITDVSINIDDLNWQIRYTHKSHYSQEYYATDVKKSTIKPGTETVSTVTCGSQDNKYYIHVSDQRAKFKIYKNSSGKLRIINKDYDIDLDLDEQNDLIHQYINTPEIPECAALKLFMFLKENEWDDNHIIIHLSIV